MTLSGVYAPPAVSFLSRPRFLSHATCFSSTRPPPPLRLAAAAAAAVAAVRIPSFSPSYHSPLPSAVTLARSVASDALLLVPLHTALTHTSPLGVHRQPRDTRVRSRRNSRRRDAGLNVVSILRARRLFRGKRDAAGAGAEPDPTPSPYCSSYLYHPFSLSFLALCRFLKLGQRDYFLDL